MDPEIRDAAIKTITDYALFTGSRGDVGLYDMIGFRPHPNLATDDMAHAMVAAVVPLLSDERIDVLMRHIAELLAREKLEELGPNNEPPVEYYATIDTTGGAS